MRPRRKPSKQYDHDLVTARNWRSQKPPARQVLSEMSQRKAFSRFENAGARRKEYKNHRDGKIKEDRSERQHYAEGMNKNEIHPRPTMRKERKQIEENQR